MDKLRLSTRAQAGKMSRLKAMASVVYRRRRREDGRAVCCDRQDDEEVDEGDDCPLPPPGGEEGVDGGPQGGWGDDLATNSKAFQTRLDDLRTCHDLIVKHAAGLGRAVAELEGGAAEAGGKLRAVNERATLFRISSNAMINACAAYVSAAQSVGRRWQRQLTQERERRARLEEMVETLARQHCVLEQQAKTTITALSAHGGVQSEDEEDTFLDCVEELREEVLEGGGLHHRPQQDSSEEDGPRTGSDSMVRQAVPEPPQTEPPTPPSDPPPVGGGAVVQRRTRVPDKPNYPLNLWSIMKGCIGKELSKIPMPVNFSEPLSFLQRLTEDFEYTYLLDKAAKCTDPHEQLAWVAAFTVSSYATTAVRTVKPFNPLLGETYECDRTADLGWRVINEQVCHHPPIVAQHVEGVQGWVSWQEFSMATKFRGKYLQIDPLGHAHIKFSGSGSHYTFRKVSTTVHNMIVGKLWLDNHGEMEIVNHTTGDKCVLKFIPYSYFSREVPKKVKGCVMDQSGAFQWFLTGTWDDKMEGCRVLRASERSSDRPAYETGDNTLLWQRNPLHPDSEKYYNFTTLACQLNEEEEGVCPTDSRHRPDQRLMENGLWDDANVEKVRLEEKQRAARRHRENEAALAAERGEEYPPYEPRWFTRRAVPHAPQGTMWAYKGGYWEAKARGRWDEVPEIF